MRGAQFGYSGAIAGVFLGVGIATVHPGAAAGAFASLRAALTASGLLLAPAGALYARALRHGGKEPKLERLPEVQEAV
jgi:hypothetical protein